MPSTPSRKRRRLQENDTVAGLPEQDVAESRPDRRQRMDVHKNKPHLQAPHRSGNSSDQEPRLDEADNGDASSGTLVKGVLEPQGLTCESLGAMPEGVSNDAHQPGRELTGPVSRQGSREGRVHNLGIKSRPPELDLDSHTRTSSASTACSSAASFVRRLPSNDQHPANLSRRGSFSDMIHSQFYQLRSALSEGGIQDRPRNSPLVTSNQDMEISRVPTREGPVMSEAEEEQGHTSHSETAHGNQLEHSRKFRELASPSNKFSQSFMNGVAFSGSILTRAASSVGNNIPPWTLFERSPSDPNVRLRTLLGKLKMTFTASEERMLLDAFHCNVCSDTSTTCHQIRAVYDAFHLSWVDTHPERREEALNLHMETISLSDLDATLRKSEYGDGFYNSLVQALRKIARPQLGPDPRFEAKDFLLAFAQATLDVPHENHTEFYRAVNRMFGIEKTAQRFRLIKFLYAFLADNLAMFTTPLCLLEPFWKTGRKKSFETTLSDATWLPLPFVQFKDFQTYLSKLWVPSTVSMATYLFNHRSMSNISVMEPLCPIVLYTLIGLIVATISGFEPSRFVMRRKFLLMGESKLEDLRAMFAFRAHTPEGHAAERIGVIADALCGWHFKPLSRYVSYLMGFLHFLVPILNRFYWDPVKFPSDFSKLESFSIASRQMWYWVAGGSGYTHALVTVPSSVISGYLVYRLMFITFDIFYNDLAFFYKLRLFRASTTAGYYLSYRRKWFRAIGKDATLKEKSRAWQGGFMQFLSLQDDNDLLLWCRIRQLLIDSCAGFKNTQRDVIFTYMLMSLFFLSFMLVTHHYDSVLQGGEEKRTFSVLDLWALIHCSVFSCVLVSIMYLKLALYDLRRSDIHLLHAEYYRSTLNNRDRAAVGTAVGIPQNASASSSLNRGVLDCSHHNCSHSHHRGDMDRAASAQTHHSTGTHCSGSDGTLSGMGAGSAFGSGFTPTGRPSGGSRKRRGSMTGSARESSQWQGFAATSTLNTSFPQTELQVVLEQTARFVQQFERPPTVLGYPVTWDVLRYMSLSLIAAFITGLKGTVLTKGLSSK